MDEYQRHAVITGLPKIRIDSMDQALALVNSILSGLNPWPEQVRAFGPGTFPVHSAGHTPADRMAAAKMRKIQSMVNDRLKQGLFLQQLPWDMQLASDAGLLIGLWLPDVYQVDHDARESLAERMSEPFKPLEYMPDDVIEKGSTVRYDGPLPEGCPRLGIVESLRPHEPGAGMIAIVRFDHFQEMGGFTQVIPCSDLKPALRKLGA